jgi:hypothetical protein
MSEKETNWETDEVIRWLINDESTLAELQGKRSSTIERWVKAGYAPQGLYDEFNKEPKSSFDDVDWNEVYESI